MRAGNPRLVLGLFLIGWESGVSFVNQSQSGVKENQSTIEAVIKKTFLYDLHIHPWSYWTMQKQTSVYLSNQDTYDYKRNLCLRFFHFQYWLSDAVEATTGAG